MTLLQLEVFVAVAEERHFGRAAARLGLTASNLSKQLGQLERNVRVRLFDRTSRRVLLTPAAELLLEPARRTLAGAAAFDALARAAASGMTGRVELLHAVNHIPTVGRLLRALKAMHPGIKVDYRERPNDDIATSVAAGKAALGMCAGTVPAALNRLPFDVLTYDTVLLPLGHRLAGAAAVIPADLDGESFLFSGVDPRALWRDHGVTVHVLRVPITGGEETATRIEQGEGIALIPARAVAAFRHRAVAAVALDDPGAWGTSEQFLVWRTNDDSPIVATVVGVVRALAAGRRQAVPAALGRPPRKNGVTGEQNGVPAAWIQP